MSGRHQVRTYARAESVVFLKTNESFGGLSNMAGGYPIRVNGVRILTSEALYQACRFPHLPEVQRMIIGENSPMTAKMRSKPYRKDSRRDWDHVRVRVMRWCLRMKLASNWNAFSDLLLKTGDRPIVEESRKDDFWGAKVSNDGSSLVGMNVLGRLLMELREQMKELGRDGFLRVELPHVSEFLLLGHPIEAWALKPAPQVVQDTATSQGALFGDDTSVESTESIFSATALEGAGAGEPMSEVDSLAAEPHLEVVAPSCPTESESLMGAYPTYRVSKLPWAPKIPDGWQVQRNGRLFSHRVETGYPDLPILEVSLRTGVRVRDMVNGKRKQVMNAKEKYKRAVKGDIAYNMMRMWQGAVGPAPTDGLVSPAYVVVRPHAGVNTTYFSYLFRTAAYTQEVNKFSRGIVADRNRLYWESFKQMPSLVPAIEVQDKIVAYLRVQDAHIARFIKAKHSALSLLAEARAVLTDQAIRSDRTQQARLDRMLCLVSKPIQRMPNEAYTAIGLKNRGRGIFHKPASLGKNLGDSIFFPVEEGDFVFSGQFAWEGSVAVAAEADHGCIASHRYPIAKCDRDLVLPEYLYTFFLSDKGDLILNHHSRGAAGRNRPLNSRTLLKEAIPIPPIDLQREVSALYKEELKVKREVEKELALMREFRDRQIADVVTGQIDLRSWQPGPEDQITEEVLSALNDDDDDTTEEEPDGDNGHE